MLDTGAVLGPDSSVHQPGSVDAHSGVASLEMDNGAAEGGEEEEEEKEQRPADEEKGEEGEESDEAADDGGKSDDDATSEHESTSLDSYPPAYL